jgi:hypothetical protein
MKGNKYADKKGQARPGKGGGGGGGGVGGGGDSWGVQKVSKGPPEVVPSQRLSKKQKKRKHDKPFSRSSEEDEDVPAMPAMSSSANPWDFRQPSTVSASSAKRKKKCDAGEEQSDGEEGSKTCPGGHPLRLFRTPHDEFFCELCGDDQYLAKGSMLFGCRQCDWDACEKHTHTQVKQRELQREEQKLQIQKPAAASGGKSSQTREGSWKHLRGSDKYKNEYMYLYHSASKVLVELYGHSSGIFTYIPGAGESPRFCAEDGQIAPFQLTLPSVAQRLESGEGKMVMSMQNTRAELQLKNDACLLKPFYN